ncbi:MAG TPA: HK97 gp10 family phage protein [Methanocorpusculum sp.]|nr:HK97 gp10 family phage protein [Methanocorpusculum sp.]
MNNSVQGLGIEGLQELNQEFNDLENALTQEIITALMRGGMIIEADAQRRCPVDTERLRTSLTTDVEREGETTFVLKVGTNVEYASFVEYGTSRMAAQPFLRPAVDAKAKDVVDEIRESIREQINGRLIRI